MHPLAGASSSPIRPRLAAPCLALACLAACTSHPLQAPAPRPALVSIRTGDVAQANAVDILFVIDNSGSMAEEQANLRQNFPTLIERLRERKGGLPDLHVGVISTDFGAGRTAINSRVCDTRNGDGGRFMNPPACGIQAETSPFLVSLMNEGQKNYDGDLSGVFSCIADLGIDGCGYEQPLLSVAAALDPKVNPNNAGFLRPEAVLAIIVISDEDDCSAPLETALFSDNQRYTGQAASLRCALDGHRCDGRALSGTAMSVPLGACDANPEPTFLYPVATFVDFVKSLKPANPERIVVSLIAGQTKGANAVYQIAPRPDNSELDLVPVCFPPGANPQSGNGGAAPPLRLESFARAFDTQGSVHSICDADFRPALEGIGESINRALEPCERQRLMDQDLDTPGVQPECVATETRLTSGGGRMESLLPACAEADVRPCWTVQDAANDTTTAASTCDGTRLAVERGGQPAPDGSFVRFSCVVCAPGSIEPGCAPQTGAGD